MKSSDIVEIIAEVTLCIAFLMFVAWALFF